MNKHTLNVPLRYRLMLIGVVLVVFLQVPGAWAGETRELTLKQAIAMALTYNQDVKIAENQVKDSEIARNQDQSNFLPGLDASAGWNLGRNRQDVPSDKTYESVSAALTATLNLFNGFSDQAALKKSRYTLASDKDSLVRTRQTVIFDTLQAYLNTLTSKEKIRVAEQNLGDNTSQLEQIDAFFKAGRRPVTDLYQQQALTASARLDLVTATQEFEVNTMKLKEMIGISVLTPLSVADSYEDVDTGEFPDQPGAIIHDALDRRADLFALQNKVWATDMAIKEAASGYYPSVNLTAELNSSYTSLGDTSAGDQWADDNMDARVGVSVSVPLFDRHLTRNQVSQAKLASQSVRYEQEKLIRQIEVEIGQAFSQYKGAVTKVDVTKAQENYAEKALESTRQRYESGAATLTELTTARTGYVQARYDSLEASLNRVIQAMSLSFYRGDMDGLFDTKEATP